MLTIGTLRLRLPAGFEHRAERIGRLLGDALAQIAAGRSVELDRLALPPVAIARNTGDAEIATRIADSVRHQLAAGRRGGDR